MERIRWWEEYTKKNGIELNNNPSPGNKAGGITTILEKSLGAVAKSGSTSLFNVNIFPSLDIAESFENFMHQTSSCIRRYFRFSFL